ncbi:MAG: caspase family protein [Armatimonadetes bacterium]|nr:caspase family protein [Armatimonadota bacterium]
MGRWLLLLLLAAVSHAAETYVVVAGIDAYDNPGFTSLQFAVADVRAVADAFRAAGVPDRNIAVLTNEETGPLRRPSRSSILVALQKARERAVEGDTLVFMFSGHGTQIGDEGHLLTVDSDRELLADTSLPMRLVQEKLRGVQGSHVLFVIDACRHDPTAGRSDSDAMLTEGLARGVRPAFVGGKVPDTALLLACGLGQRAWENPDEGHGAFTTYLLKGLQDGAKEADGTVALSSLASYVQSQVAAWAKRAHREQTPRFEAGGGDFVVLRGKPKPGRVEEVRLNATLHVPTDPSAAAVVVDGKTVGRTPYWQLYDLEGPTKTVRVEVRQPGYVPRAFDVTLVRGEPQELGRIELQRVPPAGVRPAGWPEYLSDFVPPAGLDWSWYRVAEPDGMPQVLVPGDRAFWADLHEVTVGQYKRFCAATGRALPGLPEWCTERYPVMGVSLDDAKAYAVWAGRRLPSRDEADLLIRGAVPWALPYYWLATAPWREPKAGLSERWMESETRTSIKEMELLADVSVLAGPFLPAGEGDTNPMAAALFSSESLHPLGLFGMAGGVWEWTQDGNWFAGSGSMWNFQLAFAAPVAAPAEPGLRCVADRPAPPERALPDAVAARSCGYLGVLEPDRRGPSNAVGISDVPRVEGGVVLVTGEGPMGGTDIGGGEAFAERVALWTSRLDGWRLLAEETVGSGTGGVGTPRTYQLPDGTVGLNLAGRYLLAMRPERFGSNHEGIVLSAHRAPLAAQPVQLDTAPSLTDSEWTTRLSASAPPPSARALHPGEPITGLILEAEGYAIARAADPHVERRDGKPAWERAPGDPANAVYASSVAEALADGTAGTNPLFVYAIGRSKTNSADPVLADGDAKAVVEADAKAGFLARARVVFIVAP